MLHREIIAVFSQIRTKHINAMCGQYLELLNVKMAVHIVKCRTISSPYCACLYSTKSNPSVPDYTVLRVACIVPDCRA